MQVFCAPAGKQIANSKGQSCLGKAEISELGNSEASPHLGRQWSEYSHQSKKKKTLKSPEYGPYAISTGVYTALLSMVSPAAPLQGILNP